MTPETGKIYINLLNNTSYRYTGSVYVQISNTVSSLNDLTDVTIGTLNNGQILQYNGTTSQWENVSVTIGSGDMQKSVYDIDNDGVVDYSETISVTVRNNSSTDTLRRGTIVYLSGSTGNRPNAFKAQANSESTSSGTFGVVVNDIGPNSDGLVAAMGTLHNLDTRTGAGGNPNPFTSDTLLDGDILWLDPTTAGYVTKTKPSAPDHAVFIGIVAATSPTNGRIVYKIQNGYEIDELHNVKITSPLVNNQVLRYNDSNSLWENKTLNFQTPLTLTTNGTSGAATLAGDGVLNIPNYSTAPAGSQGQIQFNNSSSFGASSNLTWDDGNNRFGILANSGNFKLNITSNTTDNFARFNDNVIDRIVLNKDGTQRWVISNVNGNVGQISFAAPGGGPGIVLWTGTNYDQNRFDIVNRGTHFTIGYNALTETSRLHIFPTGNISIGANSDVARLRVQGSGNASGSWTAQFHNSEGSNNALMIRDDGNVGIGTATPSSRLTIQGTTATDGGQLGAELLSAAGWTSAGWTGDYTTGFTHSTGNTTALTNTLAAVNGTYYQIAYTVSGRTAGTFTVTFGGITSSSLSATGSFGPRATSTGAFSITPTSDFNGTIVLSVKTITAGSATISLFNSNGTVTNEIRGFLDQSNVAIGYLALSRNTTGIGNVVFGQETLRHNTTGTYNIVFGGLSLQNNTTGSSNSVFGYRSMQNNISGNNNTSFGYSALFNSTSNNNSAFGYNSLFSNTSGTNNAAFGLNSLANNTTGTKNAAFGRDAGNNSTTALTGSNNSLFGYEAATNIEGAASGNLVLGNSVNLPSASGSNQVVIKNIIFATGASGTGTTIAGSVGIGVNAPTGRLNIRGSDDLSTSSALLVQNNATIPANLLDIRNNGNTNIGTGFNWDNVNGRLGIGTASPAARFHTVGSGNTSDTWTAQFHNSTGNNNALMIRDDGNVGIGTNAPAQKLQVLGEIGAGQNTSFAANTQYYAIRNSAANIDFTNNSGATHNNGAGVMYGYARYFGDYGFQSTRALSMTAESRNNGTFSSNALTGGYFLAKTSSVGTASNLTGVDAQIETLGAGTVTNVNGVVTGLSTSGTGNVTNAYGFRVLNLSNSSTGAITNTYGLYIGDITAGTQTNTPFSFYASDANAFNYFAGRTGIGTTAPDASAALDVTSTTQGILFPRMTTTQRDAITTPADGLVLYNTTDNKLQVRAGGAWVDLH